MSPLMPTVSRDSTRHGMFVAYHSRRTLSLSLVHVADLAIWASMLGLPFFWRSRTASADTRLRSKSQGTASSPTRVRRAMVASLCRTDLLDKRNNPRLSERVPRYYKHFLFPPLPPILVLVTPLLRQL